MGYVGRNFLKRWCRALLNTMGRAFDPGAYWEDRHRLLRGSLQAVGHRELSEENNAAQYLVKQTRIADMIRRHVPAPDGKNLLDAGCGIGALTGTYLDMGFEAVGVDFSETAIHQARDKVPGAEFVVTPLDTFDLNRTFDVITVIDVLLHIVGEDRWRRSIDCLARHLHPEGVLILLDCLCDNDKKTADHVRLRSIQSYHQAFAEVGLRIIDHDRIDLEPEGVTKDLIAVRHLTSS